MNWNPVAKIDLAAIRHNLHVAKRYAPNANIITVIKSQAYGHGMLEVAHALQNQADAFAVARLQEALALRDNRIVGKILVLEGVNDADELQAASAAQLDIVVHQPGQIALLQKPLKQAISCWVKFDTGMHRLGLPIEQADACIAQIQACQSVGGLKLMTHLANADDLHDPTTKQQLARFGHACRQYKLPQSVANSAGILGWPHSHADWVRPGLMLYGASPVIGRTAADYGLQAAMTLQARLIAIKPVRQGAAVGYGGTWQAPEDMPLGVVAVGYGDGYPRHSQAGAHVLIGQQRVPVVGRVSMDMLTLDMRGVSATVGDWATLWGKGLPIDTVAAWADTIPYTLMCGVTARVAREYSDGG